MNTSPQDLTTASNLKLPHINNQYILSTGSYAHNYLSSKYPRTIIIDDAGIVKNKFTNLDSKYLHSELNKLK